MFLIKILRDRCFSTEQTKNDLSVPRLPLLMLTVARAELVVYPVLVTMLRLASTKHGVGLVPAVRCLLDRLLRVRSSFESGRWPAESK
jgi:hypothetical protein